MRPQAIRPEKLEEGEAPEPGYETWKQRKIEQGLAQAEDRDALIPAEKVWRDFGLER